jgi:hypothetical protein
MKLVNLVLRYFACKQETNEIQPERHINPNPQRLSFRTLRFNSFLRQHFFF